MNIHSKSISMRFVNVSDAEFILKLRMDQRYNRFLSPVSPCIQTQREWIEEYKEDERAGRQFYFIIERNDCTPCGTVRIYDLSEEFFSWGSWILNEDKTRLAALESAFLVYEFGFDRLGYSKSRFDVRKENERVISFHEKMGAIRIGEDAKNFYFEINKCAVNEASLRLLKAT